MILNNSPLNEAVLSNTEDCGEFRIRNSAKAFNILSSGLYSNKIRAIIRELSCNAVDSHTAAGKSSVPFDVHLPSDLEPWFSIRDYGTGLNHEEIVNVYTTYFESTKTSSNEFIGALGLGSKSPFSYTDNFTVVAVKNGRKGIYSAFINNEGVPSIVRMLDEETNEPTGVEVKFSVNSRHDFYKFVEEAKQVYTYFKLRPVISGVSNFELIEVSYLEKDIIPGVHSTKGSSCTAVMGNIAYPISIPNAEKTLGPLYFLLNCGLELHFDIGELDFQASREGLSYIPGTVNSIKKKLSALNDSLVENLAKTVEAIPNEWEKALFLISKFQSGLWKSAASKYLIDTKNPLVSYDPTAYSKYSISEMPFDVDELASKFNIKVFSFSKTRNQSTCYHRGPSTRSVPNTGTSKLTWEFFVDRNAVFIKNDTKVGALERAKFHWREVKSREPDSSYENTVYVLNKAIKDKPALFDEFLEALHHPHQVLLASSLTSKEPEKKSFSKKSTNILILKEKISRSYRSKKELVWQSCGDLSDFDDSEKYYYLPLSGFNALNRDGKEFDGKILAREIWNCGLSELKVDVYGVRKGDLDKIKNQTNWINLEDLIQSALKNVDNQELRNLANSVVDIYNGVCYNKSVASLLSPESPYAKAELKHRGTNGSRLDSTSLAKLCKIYNVTIDIESIKDEIIKENKKIQERYPLLSYISFTTLREKDIAEYITLIDEKKGV